MTDDEFEEEFRREQAAWLARVLSKKGPEFNPNRFRGPRKPHPVLERGRWYSCDSAMGMPPLPGVYVVIVDGVVLYVGQTVRLRKRIRCHGIRRDGDILRTCWGDFPIRERFQIKFRISRRFGDWLMWEARLIKLLRPKCNGPAAGVGGLAGLSGTLHGFAGDRGA